MQHLKAVNRQARAIEAIHEEQREEHDVVALHGTQGPRIPDGPHVPFGCSFVFAPGWEVDSTGSTAGLCQPVERDLYDCYVTCFWPIHVPDLYNHAPDWTAK